LNIKLKVFLPFVGIWLVLFVPTGNPSLATLGTIFIGSFTFPLAVAGIYKERMVQKYPFLQVSGVRICPLCRETIERARFLLPYTFKTLRHYESKHGELAKDARKVRWAGTVSVNAAIFMLAGVSAWRVWYTAPIETPELEVLGVTLITFLIVQLLAWLVVRHALIVKKGKFLGS
jgi:hypothetical protein